MNGSSEFLSFFLDIPIYGKPPYDVTLLTASCLRYVVSLTAKLGQAKTVVGLIA